MRRVYPRYLYIYTHIYTCIQICVRVRTSTRRTTTPLARNVELFVRLFRATEVHTYNVPFPLFIQASGSNPRLAHPGRPSVGPKTEPLKLRTRPVPTRRHSCPPHPPVPRRRRWQPVSACRWVPRLPPTDTPPCSLRSPQRPQTQKQ